MSTGDDAQKSSWSENGLRSLSPPFQSFVADDHYSETKRAEHKKLVYGTWRTAFQLLQLAAEDVQFEELSPSSPKTAAVSPTQITPQIRDVTVELPADLPSGQICGIIRGIRNAG